MGAFSLLALLFLLWVFRWVLAGLLVTGITALVMLVLLANPFHKQKGN